VKRPLLPQAQTFRPGAVTGLTGPEHIGRGFEK